MNFHYCKLITFTAMLLYFSNIVEAQNQQVNLGSKRNTKPIFPKPYATKTAVNNSTVKGQANGKHPIAPQGFKVTKFAEGFKNPRWIYNAHNGDLLVCESSTAAGSATQITILQHFDKDGKYDKREILLSNQNKPLGMLSLDSFFYVANTDALMKYTYQTRQSHIATTGIKILDLPAGGYNNHWTRNIIASTDKTKILISVGSGSNNVENGMDKEIRRANILWIIVSNFKNFFCKISLN